MLDSINGKPIHSFAGFGLTFIPFVNGELLYKQSFPMYNLQQSIYPILELRDFIAYAKRRQVQIQHEQQLHSRKSRVHILTSHAGNLQQICWALLVSLISFFTHLEASSNCPASAQELIYYKFTIPGTEFFNWERTRMRLVISIAGGG